MENHELIAYTFLILAVGVAPLAIFDQMFLQVNDVFCLVTSESMHAVGLHYRHFDQVSDEEVMDLLEATRLPAKYDTV